MPKVVNHDERRAQIVAAAWKLIASEGIDAVTTRRIAEKTGYSNGSLRYYFPGKEAVVTAAYEQIFKATNDRASMSNAVPRGLLGLRTLCAEIMPLDRIRLDEARVAIAFWHHALNAPDKAALHARFMNEWRAEMTRLLREAQIDGDVAGHVEVSCAVDELLSILIGLQILAVLSPEETGAERQQAQLDAFVGRLEAVPAAQKLSSWRSGETD